MSKKNPLVDYKNPQCWYSFETLGKPVRKRVKVKGKRKKRRVVYTPIGAKIRGIGFVKKWRNGICTIELAYSKKRYEVNDSDLTSVENAIQRASLNAESGGFRWTGRARKDYKQLLDDGWKFDQ